MVIMEYVNYIKDIFAEFVSRKRRRRDDDCLQYISPKLRRLNPSKMSLQEDYMNLVEDIKSNASSSSATPRNRFSNGTKYKKSREIPIINLDEDDDDVIIMTAKESVNNSRRSGKFNSPRIADSSILSCDDDVKITGESFDSKVTVRRNRNFNRDYSTSSINDSVLNGSRRLSVNNSFQRISPIMNTSARSNKYSTSTGSAYRLEEKDIYKNMLMNHSSVLNGSFLAGSPQEMANKSSANLSQSRAQKMVQMAQKSVGSPKEMNIIDLTCARKSEKSTKDTIQSVIDKFESNVINIHSSSSSEVEILPTPPFPKPDFDVPRINSLKTFVAVTQPQHDNWADNLLLKHKELFIQRQKEIENQLSYQKQYSQINSELKQKIQEEGIRKCLKIREVLLPVEIRDDTALPTLTDEQEDSIDRALDKYSSDGEILSSKFNLNITRRDIRTLSGLNWLNDEVINFYMNLIMERSKDSKYPSCYATNTFFYPKVLKDGHSSIRRWTRKVDIFAHDLMVVPIHLRMHWCMAIVDFRSKVITYFDSMGQPNKLCLETLFRYLQEEHLDKKKTELDCKGWELVNAREIPQQMNGSDCGMFSCTFAEFLSRDANITFSQDDMPYLRRKMVLEILEGRLLIT